MSFLFCLLVLLTIRGLDSGIASKARRWYIIEHE
jgi:hypothetical protein